MSLGPFSSRRVSLGLGLRRGGGGALTEGLLHGGGNEIPELSQSLEVAGRGSSQEPSHAREPTTRYFVGALLFAYRGTDCGGALTQPAGRREAVTPLGFGLPEGF